MLHDAPHRPAVGQQVQVASLMGRSDASSRPLGAARREQRCGYRLPTRGAQEARARSHTVTEARLAQCDRARTHNADCADLIVVPTGAVDRLPCIGIVV